MAILTRGDDGTKRALVLKRRQNGNSTLKCLQFLYHGRYTSGMWIFRENFALFVELYSLVSLQLIFEPHVLSKSILSGKKVSDKEEILTTNI